MERPTMQMVVKGRGRRGSYKAAKPTKRSKLRKKAAGYGRKMAAGMREGARKSKYTGAAARKRKY